ncbi:MAG: glycosyltransferase family 4 protein [Caldilineaceae bacterium]|nr:glycosyltransferase family 4 protein [Caldilineaceae bacterium]
MRILYLSQYYPPEIGATQTRAAELARGLVRAGHRVTMLAEMPNHPHGVMAPEYRGRLVARSREAGIDVVRVWVKTSPEKTFSTRMAFYLSYMAMAVAAGQVQRGRYDAIYATSPPLFVAGAGLVLSHSRRTPLIMEVRDLWPESAVQLGELSNARAIAAATRLEEACYARARHIVTATEGIRQALLARGLPPEKLTVLPNGANTELYTPRPRDPGLAARLGVTTDQFVVLYTGLHGLAHGLETVLDAAALLRDRPEIRFLLVGDGPQKAALRQTAERKNLANVRFIDAVPESNLPDILALGHVGIDVRRDVGISQGTLPVKMFTYMACGLPVILAITGEATILVEKADAGLIVPPETPQALAHAILTLQVDPARRERMGRNGRALVVARYSRQAQAGRLADLLDYMVGER